MPREGRPWSNVYLPQPWPQIHRLCGPQVFVEATRLAAQPGCGLSRVARGLVLIADRGTRQLVVLCAPEGAAMRIPVEHWGLEASPPSLGREGARQTRMIESLQEARDIWPDGRAILEQTDWAGEAQRSRELWKQYEQRQAVLATFRHDGARRLWKCPQCGARSTQWSSRELPPIDIWIACPSDGTSYPVDEVAAFVE